MNQSTDRPDSAAAEPPAPTPQAGAFVVVPPAAATEVPELQAAARDPVGDELAGLDRVSTTEHLAVYTRIAHDLAARLDVPEPDDTRTDGADG